MAIKGIGGVALLDALRQDCEGDEPTGPGWFTLRELAERLNLHENTVRRRLRTQQNLERRKYKGRIYYRLNGKAP